MTAIKSPVCLSPAKNDAHKGEEELERLACLKKQLTSYLSHIVKQHPEQVNLIHDLKNCGKTVYFRRYETGELHYAGGCTCKRHLYCPLCNHRRAVTASETYGAAILKAMDKGHLWPFRIHLAAHASPDPVAQAVHLKAVHDSIRATHGGKSIFLGGIYAYSFQAVEEGFQGFLSSIVLVDLHKFIGKPLPSVQIAEIIQKAHPDLVFSVHPLVADLWDEEDLVSELRSTFEAVGLRPDSAIPHAKRWEFNCMISGYELLKSFGILSGVVLPNDSSEPVIPGISFTGEVYVPIWPGFVYAFLRNSDWFPFEHSKRPTKKSSGNQYRLRCDRVWQRILWRFSDSGIEPGDDLPSTPEDLSYFRSSNNISHRDFAEWSGFSPYLIKQWENGGVFPPPFAGALYLLYVAQRHQQEARS